jgi:hypothetical protein
MWRRSRLDESRSAVSECYESGGGDSRRPSDEEHDREGSEGDDSVDEATQLAAMKEDLRVAAELGRSLLRRAEAAEQEAVERLQQRDSRISQLEDELVRAAQRQV